MRSSLSQQLGRSQHRLNRQGKGEASRQTDAHPAVGQGFDDQGDERRSASAQPGHGIQQRFRDFVNRSHRPEQLPDDLPIGRGGLAAQGVARRTAADQTRRVRHHPYHPHP